MPGFVTRKFSTLKCCLFTLVAQMLIATALVLVLVIRSYLLERDVSALRQGLTRAEVEDLLGKPDEVSTGVKGEYWNYHIWLHPLSSYFVDVTFDSNGVAIETTADYF